MQNFEKEIREQPQILETIMQKYIKGDILVELPVIEGFLRVTFVASGTSKNAGEFGAYYFEQIAKIPAKAEFASEIIAKDVIFDENDLVIFISQSGKSADVVAALEKVKKTKAKTLAVVNVSDSPLGVGADFKIDMEAGTELAIPATKSFSATVVKLFLLALGFAGKKGVDITPYLEDLKKLPYAAKELFNYELPRKTAEKFDIEIFLGRGLNYFAMLEGALKIKEAALEVVTSFPLGEYVHGHMVTLKPSAHIVAVSFESDEIHSVDKNLLERVEKNYSPDITVLSEDIFALRSRFLTPILVVILFQIVASELAKIKGLNPDKPQGLNKVTE